MAAATIVLPTPASPAAWTRAEVVNGPTTGELVVEPVPLGGVARGALKFSPDGAYLAVNTGSEVHVYDTATMAATSKITNLISCLRDTIRSPRLPPRPLQANRTRGSDVVNCRRHPRFVRASPINAAVRRAIQ